MRIVGVLLFLSIGLGSVASVGLADSTPPDALKKIAPNLLAEIALSPEEPISIIVMMEDQVDLLQLEVEIVAAGLDRAARANRVIAELKEVAEASQGPLQVAIGDWQVAGAILSARSLWLVNAFVLRAAPATIIQIGGRADVARVFLDGTIETEGVIPAAEPRAPRLKSPGQAEPGLRVIGAPTLWERGFTGAGMIVMNLDTGVDGSHPSMSERWLGNDPGVLATDAWFDHPIEQSCPTPCDYDFHGTLTLSVLTGLETASADTIGVAFGAKWIAGAVVASTTGDILAAFEWAAEAPGGTRPAADVMSLSIQTPSEGVPGDCGPDGTYWAVVDAFEAIGGAIVWAAGNAGPGPQTITHPKNRAATPVNMCTVGNISPHSPLFPISITSSRGPSLCDGRTPKPEMVAPGTLIRCGIPGGGYGTYSGTSLAAPHAAGVITLLMQAFPWATGTEVKFALLATALDLGDPGDDNTFGNGLIDAAAAYDLLQGAAATPVVEPTSTGMRVSLLESRPNPFNPSTTLRFVLPKSALVTLRAYNSRGRVVVEFLDSVDVSAGHHEVIWDEFTARGDPAPSGLYFVRLDVRPHGAGPTVTRVQKVVLAR